MITIPLESNQNNKKFYFWNKWVFKSFLNWSVLIADWIFWGRLFQDCGAATVKVRRPSFIIFLLHFLYHHILNFVSFTFVSFTFVGFFSFLKFSFFAFSSALEISVWCSWVAVPHQWSCHRRRAYPRLCILVRVCFRDYSAGMIERAWDARSKKCPADEGSLGERLHHHSGIPRVLCLAAETRYCFPGLVCLAVGQKNSEPS